MKFHNKTFETRAISNYQRCLLVLVLVSVLVLVPDKRYRRALMFLQILNALNTSGRSHHTATSQELMK